VSVGPLRQATAQTGKPERWTARAEAKIHMDFDSQDSAGRESPGRKKRKYHECEFRNMGLGLWTVQQTKDIVPDSCQAS